MSPLRDQLLSIDALDRYEQLDLVERLVAYPETFALIEDEALLDVFLRSPDLPADDPITRAALAYVATYHHWSTRPPSGKTLTLFTHVKAQLRTRTDLRAEFEAIEARALELHRASKPAEQFEALSGHRLDADGDEHEARPDRPPRRRPHAGAGYLRWLRYDLPATPSMRLLGRGIVAFIGVLVLYGALTVADRATRSDLYHLAYQEASTVPPIGAARSGMGGSHVVTEQLFSDAVQEVLRSRRATLGLFPRYDIDRLQWAEEAFRQVLRDEQADPWLRAEAGYLLGTVLIAEDRLPEARAVLEEVASSGQQRATRARELAEQLTGRD